MLGCCLLVPQGIGGEDKFMTNEVNHLHWGEQYFLIINDRGTICIDTQGLLNPNLIFNHRK
jgi:hypothetical protein